MDTLLIYTDFNEDKINDNDSTDAPVEIYSVGAALMEHGHGVEICELRHVPDRIQDVEKMLGEKQPEVIGVFASSAGLGGAVDIARTSKRIDPKAKVVFFGNGAAFIGERLMTDVLEIDATVIGEADSPILDLIQAFEEPQEHHLEKIKGIAYRKQSADGGMELVSTGLAEPVKKPDELPIPAKYFTYRRMSLARGWQAGCKFGDTSDTIEQNLRFHSAGWFVHQLWLLNQKGVESFHFTDDAFTFRRLLVIQVCQDIIQRGLKIQWTANCRANQIDEVLLHWMRKAGCIRIEYCVKSGSEAVRKRFDKDSATAIIKRAFASTTKYGILARVRLVLGNPGETPETIRETMDLLDEIKPLDMVSEILRVRAGSALYDEHKRKIAADDSGLESIGYVAYFQTDPALPEEFVTDFKEKIQSYFHTRLSKYADAVNMVDKKDLYVYHADFLTRLALKFGTGDFSKTDEVENSEMVAENLFKKALEYYPNHQAFVGLGSLYQRQKNFVESIRVFLLGLRYERHSEELNVRLGVSYMNMGLYESAEVCFRGFERNKDVLQHLAICYKRLGNKEKEAEIREKLKGGHAIE